MNEPRLISATYTTQYHCDCGHEWKETVYDRIWGFTFGTVARIPVDVCPKCGKRVSGICTEGKV